MKIYKYDRKSDSDKKGLEFFFIEKKDMEVPLISYGYNYKINSLIDDFLKTKKQNEKNRQFMSILENYQETIWVSLYKKHGITKSAKKRISLHLWEILFTYKSFLNPELKGINIVCNQDLEETVIDFFGITKSLNANVNSRGIDKKKIDICIHFNSNMPDTVLFFLERLSHFHKNSIVIIKIQSLFYEKDIKCVYMMSVFFQKMEIVEPSLYDVGENILYCVFSNFRNRKNNFLKLVSSKNTRNKTIMLNVSLPSEYSNFILNTNTQTEYSFVKMFFLAYNLYEENTYFGKKYNLFLETKEKNMQDFVNRY